MKYIKKNIYKILITISLCLTLVLTLTFNTKTYAQEENNNGYEILPNGIQSKNLFDGILINGYHSGSNGSLNYVTGQLVTNRNLIYIGNNTNFTISFDDSNCRLDGIAYYDTNKNFLIYEQLNYQTTPYTRNTSNNEFYIAINFINDNGLQNYNVKNVMVNLGTTPLNYFPGGTFEGNNNYNWNNDLIIENEELKQQLETIPQNYFTYIIGNNYFANSNFTFNQRTNNFTGTQKVSSLPLNTPNTYIESNKLYLSQLFNYSYNNSKALNSELNYVNVYNAENYSTSNFTYLSIFPHYNLPSNERSGMSMPLKYINMIIDGTNYNGNIRITTQIPNGNTPSTYQYIDITKNSDNKFIINYPDSENYLISIDIQATYSNGTYNIPTEIISNVNQINAVSEYQIGYDTAKSEYEQALNTNINTNEQLRRQNQILQQQYQDLIQRYNDISENDNSLYNMVIAIADTPINIFQQIFNFDVLGINISGIVTMIVTILIIIWLIKKLI